MKFTYKKESNIKIGQVLYGIVEVSTRTYDGVYEVTVYGIDWNNEIVIFTIDQPCGYVECSFYDMNTCVFETREEAIEAEKNIDYFGGSGLLGSYSY